MLDPPVRPVKDDRLESAAFGRPTADSIIRRYDDAADRARDLGGIPPEDLVGQVTALTALPGRPPYLEQYDGTDWRPARVGSLASARLLARIYTEAEAADQDRYVELLGDPTAALTGDIELVPLTPGLVMGVRIIVPGRYLVEGFGTMWRHSASVTLAAAWCNVIAGPNPFVPGTSRMLAEGTTGSQDNWATAPGAYSWSYRSNCARVAALGAGEVVALRYMSWPTPAEGGHVRPAGGSTTPGSVNTGGYLALSLLAPI